jgi:zinc/manganese transport system substrate-binding protein
MEKKMRFSTLPGILVLFSLLIVPASADLTVVSTTTVLWDPIQYIGGDHVDAIYLADPTICPHMQGEVINNRIQLERDFIATADLFVAHNYTVDNPHVMPYVEDFMAANGYGEVGWTELANPAMTWNTPENAKLLVDEIRGWLVDADPENARYYDERYREYIAAIEASDLSEEEEGLIAGQDVIVMVWQKDAAEQWLGLNVVNIFAPEFYQQGKFTPAKLVDDINANPEKYQNVTYVIENMQSGELAKGVEEALNDRGIPAQRVIFTNFPKSLEDVDSIPGILVHNKEMVMPEAAEDEPASGPDPTPEAPVAIWTGIGAVLVAALAAFRRE